MNQIANDETDINTDIFNEYFKYHNLSFLIKDLSNSNETTNKKIVNHINNIWIDLRNNVDKKEILEIENSDNVIDIIKKMFNFNKPQKGKGIKILQRLPIALAQVKEGDTSKYLLNEFFKSCFRCIEQKKLLKKV